MRGVLLLAALGLGLFLLLEQSTRVYLFGPAAFHYARVASVHTLGRSGLLRPSDAPGVLYELAPDLDGYFKLARFRTSSQGLRDHEYPLARPEGSFRIVLVGSSVSMGPGLELEETFHSVLEERLNRGAGRPVEVISFAVGGYLPEQVLATLRHKALAYEPDLVLFATTRRGNPLAGARPERQFRPRKAANGFFQSFFVRVVRSRLGIPPPVEPGDEPTAILGERIPAASVFESLGAIRRERGIPIVVLRLEYRDEPRPRLEAALERASLDQGLHFVDTRPAFAGTRKSDFWLNELDRHPDAEAHRRFADVIEGFLREKRLLEQ